MSDLAERGFLWSSGLAFTAFVMATVGLEFAVLEWAPWVLLAVAAVAAVVLVFQAKTFVLLSNRFRVHALGWIVAAMAAVLLWTLAQKWMQAFWPALKAYRKMWNVFEPFALFAASLFVVFALGLLAIGMLDGRTVQPGRIERSLSVNLSAKVAAVPMAFTAVGVFVISTIWTVYHSFTNSKLLPKSEFIGFDQYERLWSTNRWLVSIENLAIFGSSLEFVNE